MARTSRSKDPSSDVSAADRGEAAKALSGIGIEVYDQNGQYQDFTKTLDELADKWNVLTDAQREMQNLSLVRYGCVNLRLILVTV